MVSFVQCERKIKRSKEITKFNYRAIKNTFRNYFRISTKSHYFGLTISQHNQLSVRNASPWVFTAFSNLPKTCRKAHKIDICISNDVVQRRFFTNELFLVLWGMRKAKVTNLGNTVVAVTIPASVRHYSASKLMIFFTFLDLGGRISMHFLNSRYG